MGHTYFCTYCSYLVCLNIFFNTIYKYDEPHENQPTLMRTASWKKDLPTHSSLSLTPIITKSFNHPKTFFPPITTGPTIIAVLIIALILAVPVWNSCTVFTPYLKVIFVSLLRRMNGSYAIWISWRKWSHLECECPSSSSKITSHPLMNTMNPLSCMERLPLTKKISWLPTREIPRGDRLCWPIGVHYLLSGKLLKLVFKVSMRNFESAVFLLRYNLNPTGVATSPCTSWFCDCLCMTIQTMKYGGNEILWNHFARKPYFTERF